MQSIPLAPFALSFSFPLLHILNFHLPPDICSFILHFIPFHSYKKQHTFPLLPFPLPPTNLFLPFPPFPFFHHPPTFFPLPSLPFHSPSSYILFPSILSLSHPATYFFFSFLPPPTFSHINIKHTLWRIYKKILHYGNIYKINIIYYSRLGRGKRRRKPGLHEHINRLKRIRKPNVLEFIK